jgi:hypothetical protein
VVDYALNGERVIVFSSARSLDKYSRKMHKVWPEYKKVPDKIGLIAILRRHAVYRRMKADMRTPKSRSWVTRRPRGSSSLALL